MLTIASDKVTYKLHPKAEKPESRKPPATPSFRMRHPRHPEALSRSPTDFSSAFFLPTFSPSVLSSESRTKLGGHMAERGPLRLELSG